MSTPHIPQGPLQHQMPTVAAAYYQPQPQAASYMGVISHTGSSMSQKPKVGLAVVCRCAPGNSNVQCLLQRRGQHSSSPNKWSFPGGRLEQPGDLEDDGAVGTKRELNEECGGGSPQGLPPLIHIECCKSGKQNQTLYHVFVVDLSHSKEWEVWQPKYRNGRGGMELDTMIDTLNMQGKSFACNHGYCWVDMGILIRECYELNPSELTHSDLQYGLVRWVQNYGEHILKSLIARSPKLSHPRRLGNPVATTPPGDGPMMIMGMPRPRASRQDSGGKPRRYDGGGGSRGAMLHPGYQPGGPFIQHGGMQLSMGGSPTNAFYGLLPANPSQLSPPTGGANIAAATVTHSNGGGAGGSGGTPGAYPGNLVVHVPPGLVPQGNPQGGLVMLPPTGGDSATHPPVAVVSQPLSPIMQSQISASVPPSKPPELGVTSGVVAELNSSFHQPSSQTQSLMTSHTVPLMATSSLPIAGSPGGQLTTPPNSGNTGGSVRGPNPFDPLRPQATGGSQPIPVSTNNTHQFLQQLPPPTSTNTPVLSLAHSLPAPPLPPLAAPHPLPSHAPMVGGESEPLLPNPPLPSSTSIFPLLPSMSGIHPSQGMPPPLPHPQFQAQQQQQQHPPNLLAGGPLRGGPMHQQSLLQSQLSSSRKEIVCRHYLRGACPYDEKCWFAHPDPNGGGLAPRSEVQGSPLPSVQMPPQYWMANHMMDYMASPPQSPMTPPYIPRPGMMPSPIFRPPRGGMSYTGQQQPFMFYRGGPMGNSRTPGSNLPLVPPNTIPMPPNPSLKFGLLSRVPPMPVEGEESAMQAVSRLETYADHFFVSHNSELSVYRIIFGGNRNLHETAAPVGRKKLERVLTCVYCSTIQPMLLLLGTDAGDVSFLDLRKGASHGNITPVYSSETPSEPVSAVTHFSTSFNSAQVVVAGNEGGAITWYISQPPQKTYSLLYTDKQPHASSKIVSLQMLGGFLVSADSAGTVVIWSMTAHTPSILSSFSAHSLSLSNLHVIDTSRFITIGSEIAAPDSSAAAAEQPATNGNAGQLSGIGTASSTPPDSVVVTRIPSSSENIHAKVAALSLNAEAADAISTDATLPPALPLYSTSAADRFPSSTQFKIKLWSFDKPPKIVQEISDVGTVICSSFHCHNPPGNKFLGVGFRNGTIQVYNIPDFTTAAKIHFEELSDADCVQIKMNLSREAPIITPAYYRNPFRDLILTSAWSNGKVMVCQVAKQ